MLVRAGAPDDRAARMLNEVRAGAAVAEAGAFSKRGELDQAEKRLSALMKESAPDNRAARMLAEVRYEAGLREADGLRTRGQFDEPNSGYWHWRRALPTTGRLGCSRKSGMKLVFAKRMAYVPVASSMKPNSGYWHWRPPHPTTARLGCLRTFGMKLVSTRRMVYVLVASWTKPNSGSFALGDRRTRRPRGSDACGSPV